MTNLSNRLAELGRQDEALAPIEEAVQIRRQLAAANLADYAPDLATSLKNLSIRLVDVGRRDEALASIEEAVQIRSRSPTLTRPPTPRRSIARSWSSKN